MNENQSRLKVKLQTKIQEPNIPARKIYVSCRNFKNKTVSSVPRPRVRIPAMCRNRIADGRIPQVLRNIAGGEKERH